MNKFAKIVELLRKRCAYDGDGSLENVKKFIADAKAAGLDIELGLDDGETLDTVHAKSATRRKMRLVVDDDEEDDDEDRPAKSTKRIVGQVRDDSDTPIIDAKGLRRLADHKRYDRRASKGLTIHESAEQAEVFRSFLKLAIAPRMATVEDERILAKANVGTQMTSGGALVPDTFIPTLIDLKEERGVARQLMSVMQIPRDTASLPKRTGGLTVYGLGEGVTITESNPTVTQINLTAVGMKTLNYVSAELLHDSAISYMDLITREMAYAFADKEDECLFNGDETSAYFGINGFRNSLKSLSGTIANIAGLFVPTGNLYSELTLPDFEGVASLLPAYVQNPVWVFHKRFYHNVVQRLELAAGGVTAKEIGEGGPRNMFLGYPVVFSQVMPRVEANSQVCALLGDFNMAAKMADVSGGMSIATSEHAGFNTDTIGIRGVQRTAICVHDVGNASATEASRIPGPVVGLITAAS